jgi:hypothetical protein
LIESTASSQYPCSSKVHLRAISNLFTLGQQLWLNKDGRIHRLVDLDASDAVPAAKALYLTILAALKLVTTGYPGPTWRGKKSFNFTSVAWLSSYKFVSCAFNNRSLIAAAVRLKETRD